MSSGSARFNPIKRTGFQTTERSGAPASRFKADRMFALVAFSFINGTTSTRSNCATCVCLAVPHHQSLGVGHGIFQVVLRVCIFIHARQR